LSPGLLNQLTAAVAGCRPIATQFCFHITKEQAMSRCLYLLLALVLCGFLSTAWADDNDKDKDKVSAEDKKFEGTWQVTAMEANGQKMDKDNFADMTFEFKGKKYWQKNGDDLMEAGTQDLDPGKKPKLMDINVTDGQTKGKKQLAIYEIEGDKIKICAADHGDDKRPSKFSTEEGSKQLYFELTRKK
jgi:uncharacterized protein (TIGR03067 family)